MGSGPARSIRLEEHQTRVLQRHELSESSAEYLADRYGNAVDVRCRLPHEEGQWLIASKGWVGSIPLPEGERLRLMPKTQVSSVFRMLEYAYQLKSFELLEGVAECDTLEEVYERLAAVLARRVSDRLRRGLYRGYCKRSERLAYVRGRVDTRKLSEAPWRPNLSCRYEEHTANIEDNQLLAWTLRLIARRRLGRRGPRRAVRRAYRGLRGHVAVRPFQAEACAGRAYNRLNEDYELMHALCRFFIERAGPDWSKGDRSTLPFLVSMPQLFERFVAAWLRQHLSPPYRLERQKTVRIGGRKLFKIDLVLYSGPASQAKPRQVIDTKYKVPEQPSPSDIAQVVAYAKAMGCTEAVLAYPEALDVPFSEQVGDVNVRTLSFDIGNRLEGAGAAFRKALLEVEEAPKAATRPSCSKRTKPGGFVWRETSQKTMKAKSLGAGISLGPLLKATGAVFS